MKFTARITAGTLALAAFLLAVRSTSRVAPREETVSAPLATKASIRPRLHLAENPVTKDAVRIPLTESEDAANRGQWQASFERLLAAHADRGEAVRLLLLDMDAAYSAWAQDQISHLAERPANERYDRLDEIRNEIEEGALVVLEELGIDESGRISATAGAIEAITAESQYAEAAPDPESRLAMLRLDRERGSRLEEALALADSAAQSQAIIELDAWYEAGMGGIFPADPN